MALQRCWGLGALLAQLLAVCACSAPGEREEPVGEAVQAFTGAGEGQLVAPRVAPGSAIAEEGLPRGKWRYQGRIPRAKPDEAAVEELLVSAENQRPEHMVREWGGNPEDEPMAIMEPNGDVYTVEFTKEERALIAAALEKRGLAEESFGDDEGAMVPKSWVNGVDNRQRRGVADVTGTNENRVGRLFKDLGQSQLNCTATFVGASQTRFFVITASHCLFTQEGSAVFHDFVPRADDCLTPTGTILQGCQRRPFGTWPQQGARMHYSGWLSNCRYSAANRSTEYCIARDIAVAEVSRPSGVAFPGAHGFAVWSTTSNPLLTHRGYPRCYSARMDVDAPDAPGGSVQLPNVCRFPTSYGRENGAWGDPFEGGLGMRVSASTSPGHSGGPLWTIASGAKILAVTAGSYAECTPKGSVTCARPAAAARITSDFYSWMLTFMGL